jgi:hypothetical protein
MHHFLVVLLQAAVVGFVFVVELFQALLIVVVGRLLLLLVVDVGLLLLLLDVIVALLPIVYIFAHVLFFY